MTICQVLLSTYNGERYLPQLLASLYQQNLPHVTLLVRDDGSRDGTIGLLRQEERQGRLRLLEGDNIGVVNSYFKLLQEADEQAGYVAFCDQDDQWLPGKLARAVEVLGRLSPGMSIPAMYCGRQRLVDEEGRELGLSWLPKRPPSFANALVQNIATGCTMVLNKAARTRILAGIPGYAFMHDWWAYLVVSAFGKVYFDKEPYVLYRQHGGNVIGAPRNLYETWRLRIRHYKVHGRRTWTTRQAHEFARLFMNGLEKDKRTILQGFLARNENLGKRLAYSLKPGVHTQSKLGDGILRCLLLLNWI